MSESPALPGGGGEVVPPTGPDEVGEPALVQRDSAHHGDGVPAADVRVVRWNKYGKDRLYVNDAHGIRIGWRDLLTGADHIEQAHLSEAFAAAALHWRGGQQPAEQAPTNNLVSRPPEDAAPVAEEAPWHDLAGRAPGASAMQQAEALRAAAPVRSFLGRLFGVYTAERNWRVGPGGEVLVGRQLARLTRKDPRWRYLNAVPVGTRGADIDHVVIGPGGVYTLNAKHHRRGTVWVAGDTLLLNGNRTRYVAAARYEAQRAGRLLTAATGYPVPVTAVIVPVGLRALTIKRQPFDVGVVPCRKLRRWLRRGPHVLDDDAIVALYEAARRSTTWTHGLPRSP